MGPGNGRKKASRPRNEPSGAKRASSGRYSCRIAAATAATPVGTRPENARRSPGHCVAGGRRRAGPRPDWCCAESGMLILIERRQTRIQQDFRKKFRPGVAAISKKISPDAGERGGVRVVRGPPVTEAGGLFGWCRGLPPVNPSRHEGLALGRPTMEAPRPGRGKARSRTAAP